MENQTQAIVTHVSQLPARERHELKCSICHHPERDAIEEAFLQWRSPSLIKMEFQLTSRTSLYRHAHAFGLFARRTRTLRSALEHIIEQAERVTPTADAIIRAVQAYTRLTDAGEWIDRPAHVIVSSGSVIRPPRRRRIRTSVGRSTHRLARRRMSRAGRRKQRGRTASNLQPPTSNVRSSIGTQGKLKYAASR